MNARDLELPSVSDAAEQNVLGALLLDNRAFDRVSDMLAESDFFRTDHRHIWRAITALIERGQQADPFTVAEHLEQAGKLEAAGGLIYPASLAQNTPSTANILNYARIVANRAALRELATTAETILAATSNPDGRTPSEIVAEAENALNGLAADRHSSEATTAAAEICALLRQADDGARHGLELGIADLDGLTGGLEPGQLFDIAARPAVGKTAFALAIADRVASNGGRVAFFSLEMSRSEIAARLLSAAARVNGRSLRTGPNPSEWQRLADAATAPGLENLIIDDKPAASVAYIRARCRRLKRQGGLALVVVDYLQLMTPADTRANRSEQVGSLSRGLKSLAKELHVPIIALAQLNRQSEARADRRPQLSDLRDSGEIEQDADLVLLLHKAGEGVIECSLAKHRNGPTGVFWLDFAPETMTFSRRYGGPPKTEKPARGGFQND